MAETTSPITKTTLASLMVRHRTALIAGCITLSAAILLFAAAIPLVNNTRSLNKKIKTEKVQQKELADKVAILSGLDQNVLDERVEILDNALPARKDVILYLSAIDGLSRELGVSFGGISIAPGDISESSPSGKPAATKTVAKKGLQSLDTTIKIRGTQDSIYTFLRTIEQVLPLMQVKNVKVSTLAADDYLLAVDLGMLWADAQVGDVKGAVTIFNDKEEQYFRQLSEYRVFPSIIGITGEQTGVQTGGKQDLFAPVTLTLPPTTPKSP